MRIEQALGGTNRAGVPAAVFAMPTGMRMRYDLPAAALAGCVTGYAIYINESRAPAVNWYLPAPAMVTVLLDAGPLSVSIRNRAYAEVAAVSLWGATSRAFRTVTHGGISVGIGLTATGWARLTARSAEAYSNSVTGLSEVVGAALAQPLIEALDRLGNDADIAPALDRILPSLFRHDHAQHAATAALERLVLTDGIIAVSEVAERLGITVRDLRRLATTNFGMPSKALLSRARFIRSCAKWMMLGEQPGYAGIDSSYFDASHFLRDAQSFLGMTPRRFAAEATGYLRTSLRARAAVIGAPAHTLHQQR